MSEGSFSADLIVIIALAAFVIFKYRQVLGHKTGRDVENLPMQGSRNKGDRVITLKEFQDEVERAGHHLEPQQDEALEALEDEALKKSLEELKQQEENFSLDSFMQGAKGAFDMVMEAFEKEDRGTLKSLLSENLFREFDQELKQFAKQHKRPQTTLVSILSAVPVSAKLQKQVVQISVRFLSEQIHVIKNDKDEIIEGDVSRIEQVEDEWVFERPLRSRNPNWTITDM